MSSWFELNTIVDPSGLIATCSTSNPPGVSSVALPPSTDTEYRCVKPSFSQGNTMRLPAAQSS